MRLHTSIPFLFLAAVASAQLTVTSTDFQALAAAEGQTDSGSGTLGASITAGSGTTGVSTALGSFAQTASAFSITNAANATVTAGATNNSSASLLTDTRFSLGTESNVTLAAIATAAVNLGGAAGNGLTVRLFDSSNNQLVSLSRADSNALFTLDAGPLTLAAGDYRLTTETTASTPFNGIDATSQLATTVNFSATAVPEPASMAVVGLGLAALRKRRLS